jgi:type IX secretion system PorP/SprF family membrane protein
VATAQDAYFSQQYANRLYLNPAYAGLDHAWSVAVAHREQWPALNGSFRTSQVAADYRLPGKKSAIGMLVQQDKAGIGGLQKLQATAGYAYHAALTQQWALSAGLQASVASLRVNYENLVFGDQLTDNGQVALHSAEANTFAPSHYLSFTAGGLLYTSQFWFGLAAAHLNKPEYGFGATTKLPVRYTANAGYKFYVRAYETQGKLFEFSITPAVTYYQQQNFKRADLGLYTIYTPLTLGLIYKGVPVINSINQDQALAVIAGLQLEQFKIGFSHDVGLKGFSREVGGGANEITLIFEQPYLSRMFKSRSQRKIKHDVACPSF